jgi:hypothetical protein
MFRHIARRARLSAGVGAAAGVLTLAACSTPPHYKAVAPIDLDPGVRGKVAGVGIESQDVVGMTDRMARDLLAQPSIARRTTPARVIIDAQYFKNEGSQILNRNTITDRLRVNLNRAAAGRMVFVGRENAAMVEHERELKRTGKTDSGTTGLARAQFGGDYRLAGRIAALDSRDTRTGLVQRYTQITLQLVDLETGQLVWEDMYEIARAAADDVVYR